MFSDTIMILYKFYQDYAVKIKVFVTHKFLMWKVAKRKTWIIFKSNRHPCVWGWEQMGKEYLNMIVGVFLV